MLPVRKLRLKEGKKCLRIPQVVSRRSESKQAVSQLSLKGVLVPAKDLLTLASKFQSHLRVQAA